MKNQQDSNQEVIPPVQTTPTQDEDDEEAILEAARHRQHAQTIVRDHLENHADNNPGASSDYVTWIATLHPENADITIDQRFFVPGMYMYYIVLLLCFVFRAFYVVSKMSPMSPINKHNHQLSSARSSFIFLFFPLFIFDLR
jgi:hypothetical protein